MKKESDPMHQQALMKVKVFEKEMHERANELGVSYVATIATNTHGNSLATAFAARISIKNKELALTMMEAACKNALENFELALKGR